MAAPGAAAAAAAAVAAADDAAAVRQPSIRGTFREMMLKLMFIYLITNYAFRKGTTVVMQPNPVEGGQPIPVAPGVYTCAFAPLEPMELQLWVSEQPTHERSTAGPPLFEARDLHYDYKMPPVNAKLQVPATRTLLTGNGTAYLHAYVTARNHTVPLHYQLNRFMVPPPPERYKNLLESTVAERAEAEQLKREHDLKPWIPYWKNNVSLAIVTDMGAMNMAATPPQIRDHMTLHESRLQFDPVFFVNDFWTYKDHFYPINDTLKELPLEVQFQSMGPWIWQMTVQMDQSMKMQQSWGAMGGEMDEMKRVLSETNPWFLGLTMVVSIVHMVFDFLAFKNDISFWKSRKSLEGLSVRSILISFGCQFIIFLYLLDNETSWMILLSAGVSVLIEGWKITKTNDVTVDAKFPFVHLADKNSYSNKTREFDEVAMRYLSYVVYPLIVVYAVYSLLYDTHKSYYSWLISSASGAVYMFGFLQMTPQLFINYKLKSVAHLPWRVFVYKALNTFIDDMFAFIIKMPTMHRLSVFRDDIIFFIFLYQRWLYRVDKTRVNEFGQSFEDAAGDAAPSGDAAAVAKTEKVD